jgi:heme exporter protein A
MSAIPAQLAGLHVATEVLPPAVRALGIGKRIDDRAILSDVSLDVREGRFIALLGANGAGKTTLLKVLATLTPATEGRLELFGTAVGVRNAKAARASIGLIGHQSMLYGDLTARENLEFYGKLYGLEDPHARADALLDALGLIDRANDPVRTFSRGMTQRVAVARALVHRPKLLLADEPFDGLDAPSVADLEDLLKQLHDAGRTIIMTNHDIAQSLRLAERAVVLRQGRVVIDRPAQSLDVGSVLGEMERAS